MPEQARPLRLLHGNRTRLTALDLGRHRVVGHRTPLHHQTRLPLGRRCPRVLLRLAGLYRQARQWRHQATSYRG